MSTQVQYRRGSAAENNAFTGALAEITVDTTNGTLRVHDGIAAGGSNIATVAYVDNAVGSLSADSISNGTSNVKVLSSGGNIAITVGGSGIVSFVADGIVNDQGNGVGNIGNATGYFNTVFATATTALYADVAERFAADTTYEPGTVVELGGSAEITRSVEELSDNVFGVISTRAAFTMNHGAGSDETHPPVAMTGRVPVRVIGVVRKGDRLVSAGNGLARAAQKGEATAFNVIGRALEDRLDSAEGRVEAIVTIK